MLRRGSIKTTALIFIMLVPLILNQFAIRTNGQQIDNPTSWSSSQLEDTVRKIKIEPNGALQITYGKKGVPSLIKGNISTRKVLNPSDAIQVLEENRKLFMMNSASSEMSLVSKESDKIGNMFKFQQVYGGIPVYGQILIVHSDLNGEMTSVNGDYDPDINLKGIDIKEKLTKEQAVQVAKSAVGLQDVKQFQLQTAELSIYNQKDVYHLAYEVKISTIEGGKPAYWKMFVDAHTGEVINKYSLIKTVSATGSGMGVLNDTKSIKTDLVNNLFYLRDVSRTMHTSTGGDIITYSANNGTTMATLLTDTDNIWNNSAAVDAHYYAGTVFDFYWTKFQRNSYDKLGSSIHSIVNYSFNYNNAFWDGTEMVYGDGDGTRFLPLAGALDVVSHELTHAVTEHSADLAYHDQSGALNESISDVFGNLVENKPDNLWLVGEDVTTPGVAGDALRSMSNPSFYGDPDNMADYVYLPNTESGDYGGVHTNSGIPNKAFYNFVTSVGVTRDDAGKVWYRALTQYLTPDSQFIDAKNYTIQSAIDLFGASSLQVLAVSNAWTAVGVVPVVDLDPYEPNNTFQTAYGPITSGVQYNGYISTSNDQDWYKITSIATGDFTINLTNLPADYDLYLYDSSYNLLSYSINGSTVSEGIVGTNVNTGTYYLEVVSYSGVSVTQPYNLTATFPGVTPVTLTGLTSDKASPQSPSTTITWTAVATGGTALQYQFWVDDGSGWVITQPYSSANTYSWKPSKAASYQIGVWVKSAASTADKDDMKIVGPYTIQSGTPTLTGLTSDKASPQSPSTTITWTAVATGGTALQYQFWVDDGSGWVITQPYSAANTYAWLPTKASSYQIGVWVKSAASSAEKDDMKIVGPYTIQSGTPTLTGLTSDKASPQSPSTTITWTATATGGTSLQYQFWLDDGSGWVITQPYSEANTYAWSPTMASSYQIGVWVKSTGSTADKDDVKIVGPYTITTQSSTPTLTGLTSDKASPQSSSTTITWTATATGGTSLQYQFWVDDGSGWVITQPYSVANTYAWTPTMASSYQIGVWVKSTGSTADKDDVKIVGPYTITTQSSTPTLTGLTSDKASPQSTSTTVTWTAVATGGTALQYQFWVDDGSGWVITQPYSVANTYAWTPTMASSYQIGVWVKSTGSTADKDDVKIVGPYTITTQSSTPTLTGLTSDKASPQSTSTTITWTAVATGGTALQYQFWVDDGSGWVITQPYSVANTYAWTPTMASSYQIGVWVKSTGSTADKDDVKIVGPYTITTQSSTPALTGLTSDKASPQSPSTTIIWTATATGGTSLQYQFWVDDGSGWVITQPYSAANTYAWSPTNASSYQIGVWVKSIGSTADQDDVKIVGPYTIQSGTPTITGLNIGQNELAKYGYNHNLDGHGYRRTLLQYEFWVNDETGWVITQPHSSSNTYAWTPSKARRYQIGGWVKSAVSTADKDDV